MSYPVALSEPMKKNHGCPEQPLCNATVKKIGQHSQHIYVDPDTQNNRILRPAKTKPPDNLVTCLFFKFANFLTHHKPVREEKVP